MQHIQPTIAEIRLCGDREPFRDGGAWGWVAFFVFGFELDVGVEAGEGFGVGGAEGVEGEGGESGPVCDELEGGYSDDIVWPELWVIIDSRCWVTEREWGREYVGCGG